jgi:tRNA-dihydrouridine synthase 1
MLCRKYSCTLATTPMIDPAGYVKSEAYRNEFPFNPADRPLVVQFGGSSAEMLVRASMLVASYCDAVELNCGCPQRCAKSGGYGAFLMEAPEVLEALIRALTSMEPINGRQLPIFVKIRVFEDVGKTISLAQMIERAGASVLTVHGRTRQQGGGRHQGEQGANWATIAAVKSAISIPVVSNGNIRCFADVEQCLRETGCDGVMSGCGLLVHPTLFEPTADVMVPPPSLDIAHEYLDLAGLYKASHQQITKHLAAYLAPFLRASPSVRDRILAYRGEQGDAESLESLKASVSELFSSPHNHLRCSRT